MWAQEHFRKPLSVHTGHRCIYKCKLRLFHAKPKPYNNNIHNCCRLLLAGAHPGWTDLKWKSLLLPYGSKLQIVFGNNFRQVFWAKEEKHHPDCFQQKVQSQDLWWYGGILVPMVSLVTAVEGTIDAERYLQVLVKCLHLDDGFLKDVPAYFNWRMPSHILHGLQTHDFTVNECGY